MEQTRKLYRSRTDRKLAGARGGLVSYFNLDAPLIRVLFVVPAVLGGSGVVIYLAIWVIVPQPAVGCTHPETEAKGRLSSYACSQRRAGRLWATSRTRSATSPATLRRSPDPEEPLAHGSVTAFNRPAQTSQRSGGDAVGHCQRRLRCIGAEGGRRRDSLDENSSALWLVDPTAVGLCRLSRPAGRRRAGGPLVSALRPDAPMDVKRPRPHAPSGRRRPGRP